MTWGRALLWTVTVLAAVLGAGTAAGLRKGYVHPLVLGGALLCGLYTLAGWAVILTEIFL